MDDIICILVFFFLFLELVNFVELESLKCVLYGGFFFEIVNKIWKRNKIFNIMNILFGYLFYVKIIMEKKLKKMFLYIKRFLIWIFIYMKNKYVL